MHYGYSCWYEYNIGRLLIYIHLIPNLPIPYILLFSPLAIITLEITEVMEDLRRPNLHIFYDHFISTFCRWLRFILWCIYNICTQECEYPWAVAYDSSRERCYIDRADSLQRHRVLPRSFDNSCRYAQSGARRGSSDGDKSTKYTSGTVFFYFFLFLYEP